MIAVIFEATPRAGRSQTYFDLAAGLAESLRQVNGFISVERFESLTQKGKVLSLSFWRDEAAVAQWRAFGPHRAAQHAGRHEVFADYRLRVAQVLRDYGPACREEAP